MKDLQTMQRHCREKHGPNELKNIWYQGCLVQYLFTGVRKSYFEVDLKVGVSCISDLKSTLKTEFLPAFNILLVIPADTQQEWTFLVHCIG
jgi:hypothetical protein